MSTECAEKVAQMNAVLARATQVCTKEEVEASIERVGAEATAVMAEENPIFLGVMQGALVFMGKLLGYCDFPLQIDYIHASRYRGETSGGILNWLVKPAASLKNRTVVIVDDILDEGLTLKAIVDYCHDEGAKKVYTVVLVDKKRQRAEGATEVADFTGLTVENHYIFGYGMDYHEYLRNVPAIYKVHPDDE